MTVNELITKLEQLDRFKEIALCLGQSEEQGFMVSLIDEIGEATDFAGDNMYVILPKTFDFNDN